MKKRKILLFGVCAILFISAISYLSVFSSIKTVFAQNDEKRDGVFTITTVKDEASLAEQYSKENRKFAAMSTVEVTGNRLWSAWMSRTKNSL